MTLQLGILLVANFAENTHTQRFQLAHGRPLSDIVGQGCRQEVAPLRAVVGNQTGHSQSQNVEICAANVDCDESTPCKLVQINAWLFVKLCVWRQYGLFVRVGHRRETPFLPNLLSELANG